MNIKEMHYNVKKKLNKVDSQQYRNLLIPEIDCALNEAIEIYIHLVAEPRRKNLLGFETSQKTTDDIKALVVPNLGVAISVLGVITLPVDYKYYLSATVIMVKEGCDNKSCPLTIKQHDDIALKNSFFSTSYDFEEVVGTFSKDGINLLKEDGITWNNGTMTYIKEHPYVHNAEDFLSGGYSLPGITTPLEGTQDCILDKQTHAEIVDVAVLLISSEIQASNYDLKLQKLKLNGLV